MNRYVLSLVILVFLLGWVGNNVYSDIYRDNYQFRMVDQTDNIALEITSKERISPADRVKEDQIHVYDNSVVIELKDPEWSTFSDTNSMDPIIDKGANAIHIIPQSEDDLAVGDIVAYESTYSEGTIIHRIVQIGEDDEGTFYRLKGDNNPEIDPGKVRFPQIKRVLVAIIY